MRPPPAAQTACQEASPAGGSHVTQQSVTGVPEMLLQLLLLLQRLWQRVVCGA